MKNKSHALAGMISLIFILAILIAGWKGYRHNWELPTRALQMVGMDKRDCTVAKRVYWYDFLKYTDGYEALVISVPEDWKIPDGWRNDAVSLREAQQVYGLSAAALEKLDAGALPEAYQAQFYSECGEKGDREFFVGLYDGNGTVLVYRGHHLYGI